METITYAQIESIISFGKNEKLFSQKEINTLIGLTKTKIITRKIIGNSTITTEEIVNKRNVNLNDFNNSLLDKLIEAQKLKIETFKNENPTLLLKDEADFESKLRREKILNWIFFIIALIIVPTLIILALCLFAPAFVHAFGHFLYLCLNSGEGAIAAAPISMCAVLIPPGLYLGLVFLVKHGIESLLGKKIFSEKHTIANLAKQLDCEKELYNMLTNNKADRQKEDVITSKRKESVPSPLNNNDICFFSNSSSEQPRSFNNLISSPDEKGVVAETRMAISL